MTTSPYRMEKRLPKVNPRRESYKWIFDKFAADLESELNNFLTIEDSIQYPPFAADPSINQEPAATSPIPDPRSNQNDDE